MGGYPRIYLEAERRGDETARGKGMREPFGGKNQPDKHNPRGESFKKI